MEPDPFEDATEDAGSSLTLPSVEPTKSGRAFLGWNTQSNGSGALYSAGSNYLVPDPESGSVTLYAQWNTYPYTVVYDLQDGESADNLTQGGVFSSTIILSLPTPDEREGFRFDGWNAAADGSGDTYADGDTYATPDRITLAPYSSGGQRVFQYGWQDVGVGDTVEYVEWQTTSTDGDRPLRKPNVAAVGSGNFLTLDSAGPTRDRICRYISLGGCSRRYRGAVLGAESIATRHDRYRCDTARRGDYRFYAARRSARSAA